MAGIRNAKTNFTAGELAPELLGRPDLRAYANGARRLRNVFIQPTGGLQRRPGLRHLALLPGAARLIAFEFNTEQTYLLVASAGLLQVFIGDAVVAQLAAPWTAAQLPQLAWTQSADTLLVCHPEMVPQRITRSSNTAWSIAAWAFTAEPFFRFAPGGVTLTPSGTGGSITVTASAAVFQPGHAGVHLLLRGRRGLVTAVAGATQAQVTMETALPDTAATADWQEAAFSAPRGWPATLCFHQDRLVIGGSRDLPNRLWLSRSGDLFNFDLGTGLDDQAIEFGLMSDQVNAIRAVFSGRHLQVFTSGAEWMVTGDPLTPANIQLNRQTRIGSPIARVIQPVDVDGSTIFCSRSGRAVHEFVYTNVQDVYQANDLALVAHHLVQDPVAMCYDQVRRLLHVAMDDGSLATLTLYRAEAVTAWTRQETQGRFDSLAEIEGTVYATVLRLGQWRLEAFDATLALDAALTGSEATAKTHWTGLLHLETAFVGILADGAPRGTQQVLGGGITLGAPAASLQAGLAFTHVVEALPPELAQASGVRSTPLRLVSITFRLLATASLRVDLGRGVQPVPFRRLDTALLDQPPASFTGDVTLRAIGWRRDGMLPLWRVEDDTPLPMTLLSVTTEIRMTD